MKHFILSSVPTLHSQGFNLFFFCMRRAAEHCVYIIFGKGGLHRLLMSRNFLQQRNKVTATACLRTHARICVLVPRVRNEGNWMQVVPIGWWLSSAAALKPTAIRKLTRPQPLQAKREPCALEVLPASTLVLPLRRSQYKVHKIQDVNVGLFAQTLLHARLYMCVFLCVCASTHLCVPLSRAKCAFESILKSSSI